jgi:NAD(P)-dependent dehydrogenase (short-subunit alcohol dehydrogenase family)
MSDKILNGRTAVISGASRGLGRAMAVALGSAGASLALVGRDAEQLDQTLAQAREAGADAETFIADVADEAQVKALEEKVLARFGKVHILINNAGMNLRKNLIDFTLDEWMLVTNTNLTSAFLMSRAFVPHMKGQGYGRVINMTSIMSHVSLPGRTAYSSTKTALLGFTRALALELAAEGITVVAISPGPFATDMNQALIQNPEANAMFLSKLPAGRWGQPEEIGKLALYVCSPDAGFLTGTDIIIDGGWCAQ